MWGFLLNTNVKILVLLVVIKNIKRICRPFLEHVFVFRWWKLCQADRVLASFLYQMYFRKHNVMSVITLSDKIEVITKPDNGTKVLWIGSHTFWYKAHAGREVKSQKTSTERETYVCKELNLVQFRNELTYFCFISWFFFFNNPGHPRFHRQNLQDLRAESHFCSSSEQRQTGWWMHRRWVMRCTCRKEFTPSGSWTAPEPRWWRTGEWMIDEDVRLQIDHQISGLLYLLLWCNQSHPALLCPPVDDRIYYLGMSGPSDI